MLDVILDGLIDTIKVFPFLLISFVIIEILEHKINSNQKLEKAGRLGPLFGSLLGTIPQCGIASIATNLYVTGIITMGTLISVFLATSDEMIPILLSEKVSIKLILIIIGIKFIVGLISGFVIDLVKPKKIKTHYEVCEEEHCHCEEHILISAFKHTLNITLFILVITFILNLGFSYLGEDLIAKIFLKNNIFSSFISSLVGLIPNCGASIMITELYLSGSITFGSAMSGLLTGSGIGILILFKNNKNLKENMFILLLIYFIGVFSGIIIDLVGLVI